MALLGRSLPIYIFISKNLKHHEAPNNLITVECEVPLKIKHIESNFPCPTYSELEIPRHIEMIDSIHSSYDSKIHIFINGLLIISLPIKKGWNKLHDFPIYNCRLTLMRIRFEERIPLDSIFIIKGIIMSESDSKKAYWYYYDE